LLQWAVGLRRRKLFLLKAEFAVSYSANQGRTQGGHKGIYTPKIAKTIDAEYVANLVNG